MRGTESSWVAIAELPEDLLVKEEDGYRELLSDRLLWSLAHHSDPFLRRAVYKLLQITLQEQPGSL